MSLSETLQAVKDENLSRGQLEQYEMSLSSLYADYMVRLAVLEKSKALFFLAKGQEHPEMADVKIKRIWNGTDDGIELTQKKLEVKAVSTMLRSIRSRIYQTPNY